jgi:hypothetical protein
LPLLAISFVITSAYGFIGSLDKEGKKKLPLRFSLWRAAGRRFE